MIIVSVYFIFDAVSSSSFGLNLVAISDTFKISKSAMSEKSAKRPALVWHVSRLVEEHEANFRNNYFRVDGDDRRAI